jgi:chorismate mutase/prephenate dehydratase
MIAAFQGIDGAHSQIVLEALFSSHELDVRTAGYPTFRSIAMAVNSGRADVGIVPVDNLIAGTIREGYELLLEFGLTPLVEIAWTMDHRLLGVPGATLADVREVLGHPLVIAECGKFLASLTNARAIPCEDTGIAAREVSRSGNTALAAIAPPTAATLYALTELAARVGDYPENFTRFIVFGASSVSPEVRELGTGGPRKTSFVLVSSNEAGSLGRSLATLAKHGISVAKIESKPMPGRSDVAEFYVDVDGDLLDTHAAALADLKTSARGVRMIGSYHAGVRLTPPAALAPLQFTQSTAVASSAPAIKPQRASRSSSTPRVEREAREDRTIVRVGGVDLGGDTFTIIAGPCSVESREQVMSAATAVKARGAHMLRGGAFKPRTNPYAFQGLGWEGVALLAEAGRATGLPTVSEVMSIDQVDRMAAHIDVLQIGARNMQNFDLLKAVGRSGKPVLLKRGLSATIDELLASAEYILAEGNPNVVLCERGIRTFEIATRNTLDLSAVPVLRERTHLPIVVDPSHGVGVRRWIAALCRAAKAVGADGIIVEVHPNPDEALSDKDQALTFDDFATVTSDLARIPSFEAAPAMR